ncbi:HAD family hydrolase [Pelagicoccus sp. SDUM812003]|uniref:HAD family hydrolase n=1 Tax=Pelagicoccus sp. SDUM812003 TaxID=3041267 RepID=UPI00280DA5B8|nr:HAD family hydrolase [Pelagicoccus sp. SDUM812003]MDQ8203383.1 HAD family hydrolase [Pelagicoccus sp. SDUM812003]
MNRITTIAFDADDTLWHNENLFEEHHQKYCQLLSEYHEAKTVEKTLFSTEMKNLELYGYGVKSFMLSSIETAIELTQGAIPSEELKRIIEFGQQMLKHPVELLDGVEKTITQLSEDYRLILITKGDLRDQERKIAKSGLSHCFEHTEVVSEKNVETYSRLFHRLAIEAKQVVMVGNSLKSDVLPILDLGGVGVHIPYHLTWEHERIDTTPTHHDSFHELSSIRELPELIKGLVTP